ncbi:MAG TPA: L-seryl-tRNA(Sec) selenium transferase [Gemmatimonadales bacterium]|nr:L-seryl-tRNA(Sec) selenium transferase [Gemmatimonadales bacterium]
MTDPRRQIPSIDALLAGPAVASLLRKHPRALIVKAARATVEAARSNGGAAPQEGWDAAVRSAVERLAVPSLAPVINATGVVLHTNLGRAPLADAAIKAMTAVAGGYAALEYDLESGTRGSRHAHCRDLLVELTGAQDAMVVNNAAGAVLLALSALGRGGEAIVSRGELVEIGGAFRIPDIMARSGAKLVEVGTTNRTHPRDYERALTPDSRLLLKVHKSNFQISGFTTDVALVELAELAHARGISCIYDLGSGLLLNLSAWGLTGEPTVPEGVAAGADVVIFSGDKLLGGPQAGILVGTKAAIDACRTDPLARAVRADKLTLAALEATLAIYRDPERAVREIPVLYMLTENEEGIRARAQLLGGQLIEGDSEVGGGAFPGTKLRTWLAGFPDESLAERLRGNDPPIIARVAGSRVLLDARTIFPEQVEIVIAALRG